MDRKATTKSLSSLLERHINPQNDPRIYMSKEVTFDYGTLNQVRVDYMRFVPVNNTVSGIEKGDFYCYEVKSSIDDFHSKNGHNFIGDFNYYVMPLEVYEKIKDEIPFRVGVYVPNENGLKVVRCKDCKHYNKSLCTYSQAKGYRGCATCVEENDFCSYGERKDG